jgi:putative ABC transport system permease protein
MLQDYKLGFRMLLKYPGLTIAGGLALAFAIGVGVGAYDLLGKVMTPAIPLPDGDRIVLIETQNTLTNAPEPRVVRDFLEWRRELRTIVDLGAYRTNARNLLVGGAAPVLIQMAEVTAAAFRTARVPPLLGRPVLDSDEVPGAPGVVVLGYGVWQHSLGGRPDIVGAVVKLGNTPATVIGVMPDGFSYPVNHQAWMPLQLRAAYGALEGGAIDVIGRLAPDATRERAEAELRVLGERAATALPATHEHLRPRLMRLGRGPDDLDLAQLALRNVPGLLVLIIACMNVGTLFYARTATREGEIALRSALGATRARIIGQLFVEALVLASIAAAIGLVAADRILSWGIESAYAGKGGVGAPFWMTSGLELQTILYAIGLAVVSAAMLSLLPALRATRARVQSHLANLGTGGATLRFGRVWTGAMIAQVVLTTIGIPVALENASQSMGMWKSRAGFPSGEYVAARIDLDRPFDEETPATFGERRARTLAALERRLAQEPGVVAVTFADRVPGVTRAQVRVAEIEGLPGNDSLRTSEVDPGFFEAFGRPVVAGRDFHEGDRSPAARTVIVNEAFARDFNRRAGRVSPIGARLRYVSSSARSDAASVDQWFEIVGVVRDFGLDPGEDGSELPFVFRAAPQGTVSPLLMSVRVRGNPAPLVARVPSVAAEVDAGLYVKEARPLDEWIRRQERTGAMMLGAQAGVTALVLLLSALAIFSLMSVSVSRRTREIGLRMALGAPARHVVAEVLTRAMVLLGSGVAAGGVILLSGVALDGPSGRPAEDFAQFAVWFVLTAAVMAAAGLLACVGPARRALRINPIEALREA